MTDSGQSPSQQPPASSQGRSTLVPPASEKARREDGAWRAGAYALYVVIAVLIGLLLEARVEQSQLLDRLDKLHETLPNVARQSREQAPPTELEQRGTAEELVLIRSLLEWHATTRCCSQAPSQTKPAKSQSCTKGTGADQQLANRKTE